jgi:5-formyltetrahydrofolate cyclo-ligase
VDKNLGTERDDKVVLRRKFRDLRRDFKSREGRSVSQQLQLNLQKFIDDFKQDDMQFALYRSRRDEAPCNLTPVTGFFYPALTSGSPTEMEFRKPDSAKAFQSNKLAFDEPVREQSTLMDTSKPMIVFCPAVAIDHEGRRLGLGKGFYDRFFAKHPQALRVGVVFHVQISSHALPAESWDQNMDWIITEKVILRVPGRSTMTLPI